MLLRLVGTHERKALVRPLPAARPGLLTIDDVMIALVLGEGLQAREIRAGARLRIALAPAHFAFDDARDMLLLLLFVAVFEKRRAEHHHAHAADRVPCPDPHHFLAQHTRLFARQATAAIFLRPGRHAPALRAHRLAPCLLVRRLVGRAVHGGHRIVLATQALREIRLQPGARFLAEAVSRIGGTV